MSRVGKKPIPLPAKVDVSIEGQQVTVKGPKATLKREIKKDVNIAIENGEVTLTPGKTVAAKALWGTYAAHVRNMVTGVTTALPVFSRLKESGTGLK